ncbi:nuclear transport factor 2 family protein [Sphingomonas montanisoli]|uniref:SnoaL-like domain-containing protein n=1 Tax=Sphingomonas montanisoli TaxID=2606412 RepID=A0A5D9C276_9SPHN|nr:nuclear transport factor 2 family protein [Sphingomonas montanisoli]TZG25729.1 hypothetical protein FYJ91_12025 [Sphingomonas montanisoli]
MPTREQIAGAMQTHFDAWNAQDRSRWMANFSASVVFEDPIGGPKKVGTESVRLSWDNSFKNGRSWKLEPILMQICSDQAACHIRNTGDLNGETAVIDSIEVYTIGDDGKIAYVRTWFTPPPGVVLDPYFMQAHEH